MSDKAADIVLCRRQNYACMKKKQLGACHPMLRRSLSKQKVAEEVANELAEQQKAAAKNIAVKKVAAYEAPAETDTQNDEAAANKASARAQAAAVRAIISREKWFEGLVGQTMKMLQQAFAWKPEVVYLFGVKGGLDQGSFTREEWTMLLKRVEIAFMEKRVPGGDWSKITEVRASIEEFEQMYVPCARGDRYIVVCSCPTVHYKAVRSHLYSQKPNILEAFAFDGDVYCE